MLDLNSFERFASLSQKKVSTASLRNLEKKQKCPFQTLTKFVFQLEVAPAPYSNKLPLIKLSFK